MSPLRSLRRRPRFGLRRIVAVLLALAGAIAYLPTLDEAGQAADVRPAAAGAGLWGVAGDGGIFSFGDAGFFGSTGAISLNRPIVGMAGTPSGRGYWLVASDGGLFSYGDAPFLGSSAAAGVRIASLLPTADGAGYWQLADNGAVFAFGNALPFPSSVRLNQPLVGGAARPGLGGGLNSRLVPPGEDTSGPTAPGPDGPPAKVRPNILFVLLDDMRWDGVMNVPDVLPKTKQWLQAAGTTFSQAYTTTSLCCPERATIWSGRYEHNHHVVDNESGDNLDREWISPRYLQDAGYNTALVGKFITDWKYRYEPPHFDQYAAFQGDYVNTEFWVKNPGDATHHSEIAAYSTDWIGDKASEFIDGFEAHDDQPWFMQVAPHAPHDNKTEAGDTAAACDLDALYDWPARYDNTPIPPWNPNPAVTVEAGPNATKEKADKVATLRSRDFTQPCGEVTYEGAMRTLMAADDMVDEMMLRLQADGELANTMVVFTTDNGYSWDERGVTSKGWPYREDVEAPFLVRWDGVFPAGAVDGRPVGGQDLLPTYLDALQYTPPQLGYPLDGRSFLPGRPGRDVKLLEFGPIARPTPDGYVGHRGVPTWSQLATADWAYIEYYGTDNVTVQWREYYDLRTDPWEIDNLLFDQDPSNDPDVAALSAQLRRYSTCAGTTGPSACP